MSILVKAEVFWNQTKIKVAETVTRVGAWAGVKEAEPYKWLYEHPTIQRDTLESPTGQTPGEQIVRQAMQTLADRTNRGRGPQQLDRMITFSHLFDALVDYGRNHNWLWKPQSRNSTTMAYRLLDGTAPLPDGSECRMFCVMLETLATAPPPCGLGIAGGHVQLAPVYSGRTGKGFIASDRWNGTSIDAGFEGNVRDPRTRQLSGLTFWDNHKVVHFNGMIWDPSYGAISNDLEADLTYQVVRTFTLNGEKYCEAVNPRTNARAYFLDTGAMTNRVGAPMNLYEGPIDGDELPRDQSDFDRPRY